MTEWQPIETAPKDGTLIRLGWITSDGLVNEYSMKWVKKSRFPFGEYEGWSSDDLMEIGNNPTHWMPLPAPPNQP